MYNDIVYHHDNLCFKFDFVEADHHLALGLKVADEKGQPIMQQAYPFEGGAGAAWLLYWHLLKAAGQQVIHNVDTVNYSCNY